MTGIGIGIGMHDNVMAADSVEAAADEYKGFLDPQGRRKRRGFSRKIPSELAPRRGVPCDGRCRQED